VSAAVLVPPPPSAAAETSVEVFADEHALARLEGTWNQLVEESGIVHPFVRHEWVRRWWEAFGRGRKLHLVLVRDDDGPLALAPLMLSRRRHYGVAVRTLEFLANEHVPRFDVIVARRPAEAYRALWEHLAALEDAWDVIQLQEIPAGSATLEELPRLAAAAGYLTGRWPSLRSPYLPTLGGWEMYLRGLTGKQRRLIRNRMRRLTDRGAVELEVVAGPEEVRAALDEGLRLEDSGWKAMQGTAILSRPDTEAFYRTLAETAAERGWLRLCFLRAGGRRVAFAYTLDYGRRRYLLKVGYDPAWSGCSPQNSLHALALPLAFASGCLEYDFLGNNEEWKRRWTPHERVHEWLFVFRPELRLRLVHGLKFGVIPRLRRTALYRTLHERVFGPR
jgi:CelD/BcsL family acetyltransferase involved in cellulose biosynthesis